MQNAKGHGARQVVGLAALVIVGLLPLGGISQLCNKLQATLKNDAPNARDYEQIEHRYYERLIEPTSQIRARSGPIDPGKLAVNVDDVREYVLKPNLRTIHKNATWTTNSLGLRDREYSMKKAPQTLRIALIGDSIASGWGVDDGKGFEPLLEQRWNARYKRDDGTSIEVLNFAVPGHSPGQRWEQFKRIGWQTSPDLIIFESTLADLGWDERRLRALIPQGLGIEASVYSRTLQRVHLSPDTHDLKGRLRPLRDELLAGVYQQATEESIAHQTPIVWVLLPRVGKPLLASDHAKISKIAQLAGFTKTIDASTIFDGKSAASLAIAPDDFHPNAAGHSKIAEHLDAILGDFVSSLVPVSRPEVRGLSFAPGRPDPALNETTPSSKSAGADSQ
jgi:lysophospholipase L1-like esterase